MVQPLKGIHHVTAITSSAEENYRFFTYVLGMRLVKKTVNQDDINTVSYTHLTLPTKRIV